MAKKPTVQEAAATTPPPPTETALTFTEERFIDAYLKNGGNGTRAYLTATYNRVTEESARVMATRLIARVSIQNAIERERARLREVLNFGREDALRIYLAMALAQFPDFALALEDVGDPEAYAGLGDLKHAIKEGKRTRTKDGDVVCEIKLYDKKAAVDALWEKLGLDKDTGGIDRVSFFDRFAGLASKLGSRGDAGKPTGSEGSS